MMPTQLNAAPGRATAPITSCKASPVARLPTNCPPVTD